MSAITSSLTFRRRWSARVNKRLHQAAPGRAMRHRTLYVSWACAWEFTGLMIVGSHWIDPEK